MQVQQYKNQADTDKAIKRILVVSPEDDVNLALKNFKNGLYDLVIADVIMPQINGFDLEEEIKKIDQKVKVCFLIAGEIPGKLRSNQFIAEGEGYEDKFIQIPIENNNLIRHVAILIDS